MKRSCSCFIIRFSSYLFSPSVKLIMKVLILRITQHLSLDKLKHSPNNQIFKSHYLFLNNNQFNCISLVTYCTLE